MPAAPAPPKYNLDFPTTHFAVLIGANGTWPLTLDDEVSFLYPVTICRSATGARDDFIMLAYSEEPRLVNSTVPAGNNQFVEVRALDDEGEPTIALGWGQLVVANQRIDGDSEVQTIEVRILDAHFGKRLTEYPLISKSYDHGSFPSAIANVIRRVQHDVVFNPSLDGEIRNNCNGDIVIDWTNAGTPPARLPNSWLDYQSAETDAARTNFSWNPVAWTIRKAIYSTCWLLNPDETYIKNPLWEDLIALDFFDDKKFKNVQLKFGSSLPECLDQILIPLEFGWYLNHTINDGDQMETAIKFYQRGEGDRVSIMMQKPGTRRNTKKTNVTSFEGSYSLMDLANRIEVYGELKKQENTFYLDQGWDPLYNGEHLHSLRPSTSVEMKDHPEVGRFFVFSEDGTYRAYMKSGFDRGDFNRSGSTFSPQLSTRRRRFLKCLTKKQTALSVVGDQKAQSIGYVVQWWDKRVPMASDPLVLNDPGWKKVEWPYTVLEKQCGIRFDGETPPPELWKSMSGTWGLRIVATVMGDRRISGIATREDSSPNGIDMPLVLDMRDKFEKSEVIPIVGQTGSIYDGEPNLARDDTDAIQSYAEAVRNIEDVLRLDASIELEGCLHPDLEIGDVLPRIKGRNLSLELNASGRSPQILGFKMQCQQQRLELLMESFRKERPQVITTRTERQVVDPLERQHAVADAYNATPGN